MNNKKLCETTYLLLTANDLLHESHGAVVWWGQEDLAYER
jgi:hypothetical protein